MKDVVQKEQESTELPAQNDLSERQYKVLDYVRKYGRITNKVYRELFDISRRSANRELNDLIAKNIVQKKGKGRNVIYVTG